MFYSACYSIWEGILQDNRHGDEMICDISITLWLVCSHVYDSVIIWWCLLLSLVWLFNFDYDQYFGHKCTLWGIKVMYIKQLYSDLHIISSPPCVCWLCVQVILIYNSYLWLWAATSCLIWVYTPVQCCYSFVTCHVCRTHIITATYNIIGHSSRSISNIISHRYFH